MDYLDTSAFVKLVSPERESDAMREALRDDVPLVSSSLLLVESRRAAARHGGETLARTLQALRGIVLVPIDDPTLERAAALTPPELRSLDAIHLSTAASIGDDLERFYCYDLRLAAAATAMGFDVHSPDPPTA